MTTSTLTKQQILDALRAFARQRPGLEFGNYGDWKAYRAELRGITKDLSEAQRLLRAVELRDGITADMLLRAQFHAFGGRLSINPDTGAIDYCTGQYWPTEYRRAVCALLATALWDYWRDSAMPAPTITTDREGYQVNRYKGLSAGEYLRKLGREEFGPGIAQRWFN